MPKFICILTLLIVSSGCVNSPTIRFNNKHARSKCENSALINVVSSGIAATLIRDTDTYIGEVGTGGNLTWCRPAGYLALIASPISPYVGEYPAHVVIFKVDAGVKYSLGIDYPLKYGRIFPIMSPQDFSKDSIALEKVAEKLIFLNSDNRPYNEVKDQEWLPKLNALNKNSYN